MRQILASTLMLCMACVYSGAQSTAGSQVSGIVQDSSGAALAGASVTITNVDTEATKATISGDDGSYTFTNLVAGPYKLQVTKGGFATYNQSGLVLQINTNPQVNVTLKLGTVSEQIEVQANVAMVETSSNGVGQVIDQQRVVDLPLNGRNVTQLIALSGAAVPSAPGGIVNTLNYPTVAAFSVAGGQGNATNFFLDGSSHLDPRTNVGLPLPFPDALQEFKVETSTLPANYGNHPGGAVNAVTKSGTNAIHGDAFEFVRNYIFGARNTFSATRDSLKRNQFGGTVGGPIRKDRLFFFAGIQETTERTAPATTISYVPTAATLAGDFQAMLAPPCQAKQVNASPAYGFVNNILPVSLLNPVALKFAALLPVSSDPCGKLQYGVPTIDNESQGVMRLDFQRTASDSMFMRYFIADYALQAYYDTKNILTANAPGLDDRVQTLTMGDTRVLSNSMVNLLRGSFSRSAVNRHDAAGIPTLQQLGANIYAPIPNFTGQFAVSNYFNTGALPGYVYTNIFSLSDELELTRGRHQITAGVSWVHPQMNGNGEFQINPGLTFNGQLTGNALADFLSGNLDALSQGGGQVSRDGQNIPSIYLQDNWKAGRRLKLNAGVRWDPFIPQHTKYGYASQFSTAAFYAGKVSSAYTNAPPGLSFPGDAGFPGMSDTAPRYGDFAPRVGLVFDPRGSGRETIRAGYGVFFDSSYLWNTLHVPLNPPWGQTIQLSAPAGGLSNPWSAYPGGNPFPFANPIPKNVQFPVAGVYVFEPPNAHATNLQQWNLAFQKQLSADWLVSATYLGNKTTHQWLGYQINPAVYIPGGPCTLLGVTYNPCSSTSSATARRALALANPATGRYFGSVAMVDDGGNASYNALLVAVQHRFSHHFSALANYTWSHCFDEGEASQDIGNVYQNPANRLGDRGNCASDRRQVFNASLVGESPRFASKILRWIAGNWQASAIFTDATGAWLTITDGVDNSLTSINSDRPNVVGDWRLSNPTLGQYFNVSAFAKSTLGTYGNAGKAIIPGRTNWNLDLGLWRSFPVGEHRKVDFRAEAFNAVNHAQYGNPNTSLNAGTVGQTTTAANPRIMQLAMKITF